ncbi:MAG: LacI family transcriptional regulator [Anaerolinea sp.]|nr:LacI family transcriptional regulator [Anaerolinea sp.]
MAPKSRVTMADIARQAGVSLSTVSRALSGSPAIPETTRSRVQAIAASLNYRLDERARNFRLRRSGTVAVLFPYQGMSRRQLSDPFYLEIAGAIMDEFDQAGNDLLMARVPIDREDWPARYVVDKRVDGLILIDRAVDDANLKRLEGLGARFVVWGARMPGQQYVSVGGDSRAGAADAIAHLVELGRRRIGFIGGFRHMVETEARRQGYVQGLERAGLPLDDDAMIFTDFSSAGGRDSMHMLLERCPDLDAVFVCSDHMAIAAMDVIKSSGRRIPDDIAVVGYDDIPGASVSAPPLTTVRQPIQRGGKLLARKLLALIKGEPVEAETLPVELIVRASTVG